MGRALQNVFRLWHIVAVALRHGGAHLLGRWPFLARRLGTLSGPVRLRTAIEEVGGTFIQSDGAILGAF